MAAMATNEHQNMSRVKVTTKQFGAHVRVRRERSASDREATYAIDDDIHVDVLDDDDGEWVKVAGYNSTTNGEAYIEACVKARELQKEKNGGRGGKGRPPKHPTWVLPLESANSGVYAIECTTVKRMYVGASTDVRTRLGQIRMTLQKGAHPCADLQLDFAVLGPNAFQVRILEAVEEPSSIAVCRNLWVKALREQKFDLYNEQHREE